MDASLIGGVVAINPALEVIMNLLIILQIIFIPGVSKTDTPCSITNDFVDKSF